jgi:cell division protein FtsL
MDCRVKDFKVNGHQMSDQRSPGAAKISPVKKARPMGFAEQMREFLRRNMSWFLIAALALLFIQDIFGTHGVLAMHRSLQEAAAAQKEIDQLNDENRKLQDHVEQLKTDPAEIERIAREQLGLARPGEYIFKVPSKTTDPSAPGSIAPDPPKRP